MAARLYKKLITINYFAINTDAFNSCNHETVVYISSLYSRDDLLISLSSEW